MRLTKKLLAGVCPVAILVAPLVLSIAPAFAQSTGTQEIETVVVTGVKVSTTGLMTPLEIPKERSIVTKEYIDTQPAGQTVFETLNTIPGLNFTNSDPYGNSGGNIRLHGMDGNRISLTWDGMPLNDTGNYATYTNQVVDTEIIDRVSVNQGTTDVDSPTASSTGGVINILTARPAQDLALLADLSVGSFNYRRGFFRVDSGEFGPWGTRAFATYSYTMYDKFKGPGNLQKNQINADIYQDVGDVGWFNIAAHFNRNRNDQYNNVSFLPISATKAYLSSIPKTTTPNPSPDDGILSGTGSAFFSTFSSSGSPNVALDPSGHYTGVIPPGNYVPIAGFGMNYDEDPICTRPTPGAGVQSDSSISYLAGATTSCTGFYKLRINPSDTGNIRASSLWHVTQDLTFTLDANFQYVLANGGGFTAVSETDAKLRGATTGTTLTGAALAAATVAPFGCIAGNGCDLNGDGDIRDTVAQFTPNNTNTRRYGINAQLIYALNDANTFQFAYVLDWGLHRQTGQWSTFDNVNGPNDVFGGLNDPAHRVNAADGYALRQRDRKSYAVLNQFSFDYEGRFFADSLRVSVGVRLPYFMRELHQYCYNQTTGFAYCTTELPTQTTAQAAVGLFQFPGAGSTYYTPPGSETVNYARTLPNAGVTWLPFGPQHQFFATYAQGISVPRTDNLYNGGTNGDPACHTATFPAPAPCRYTTFENDVAPETTATYDIGYRFTGDWFSASVVAWNTQYRNRIVTTYDPDQGISVDHNIGTVNMDGVDLEGTASPIDNLNIYQSISYLHSRVAPGPFSLLVPGSNPLITVSIAGKEVLETPNWTESTYVSYKIEGFRVGLGGKYVGRRYATDNNDFRVPPYFTMNADVTYDLGEVGWDNSYLKFNVSNLLDRQYFGSVATSKNCFTPYAPTTSGCTSYPLLGVGFPRTFQIELRSVL